MATLDLTSIRESVRDLIRTPQPFREWLAAKHPAEIVGKARCSGACPFVNFLNEKHGGADARIECALFDITSALIYLPQIGPAKRETVRVEGWLKAFVLRIDKHAGAGMKRVRDPITAAEAIAVLDFVS